MVYVAIQGITGNYINYVKPQIVLASACSSISIFQTTSYLAGSALTANSSGYVGVGNTNPQAPLHVTGSGISVDTATYSYSGDLSIQALTGGRSTSSGAQLEFVIPANTDGTNAWGQGRILTVAGNTNTSDATGKMILGTRRYFNKTGSGGNWYYGNDLIIDGSGNVGIGTLNPQSLLSVKGIITAKELNVTQANWSDFVFDSAYRRMTLDNLANYIRQHKHLPDIPSTAVIEKDGLELGAMQKLQMQKIEELTLYAIDADKRIKQQDSTIALLQERLEKLEQKINDPGH